MAEKVPYSRRMSSEDQVQHEEQIAAILFDHPSVLVSEETAADLGREILYQILRNFRRDLFVDDPAMK